MFKSIFADFLVDPRKLLVGGFLLCLATMSAHVMDCEFAATDYLFIVLCIVFLLPLFTLGKLEPLVEIEIPNKLAAGFLFVSIVLTLYNISLFGAPLLLLKILRGESLEKQYGFYYHHQFKLSFMVWSLFTVLIPMAFFVKSKVLGIWMVVWSVVMSTLIQIKMPFLFGFLYAAILFRLTGRKIRMLPLAISAVLLAGLFWFVNSTRTGENLADATYVIGLSETWAKFDPVIWGPASYLAAPIANALLTIQYEPFRFDADGILKVLPSMLLDSMGSTYDYEEKFPALRLVRWYDASNIISGWGHLANNLGVIGMLAFNTGIAFVMVMAARSNFFGKPVLLAFFIVNLRNCALYSVEDYFFEPTALSEFLLLAACFQWAKINLYAVPPVEEGAENAADESPPVGAASPPIKAEVPSPALARRARS